MSWPAWVLNETNRQLQRHIDHITEDIQKKSAEVESGRETVALLRKNLLQVKRHVLLRTKTASELQERLRKDEEELQSLIHEGSYGRAELHALRRRHEEVQGMLQGASCAVRSKVEALKQEQRLSEALERTAVEVSVAFATMKNAQDVHREMERRQHRLETVQASLAKAHAALSFSRSTLQREEEEFALVQRELEALRLNAVKGKHDRNESWLAVSRVQEALAARDSQIAANAEVYAGENQTVEARRAILHQLRGKYKELQAQLHTTSNMLDSRRRDQHALLARLHAASAEVQRQEDEVAALRRQLAAQRDVRQQVTLSCRNTLALRNARSAQLEQLRLRSVELEGFAKELRMSGAVCTMHELENARGFFLRRLQQLEGQIERVSAATMACLSDLQREGRVSEELNHKVFKTKEALLAADRDYTAQRQSREICQRHFDALEARVKVVKEGLEQTRNVVREKSQEEQAVMEGVAQEMQMQLHRLTQRGLSLRRDITPLQCALNAHARAMDDARRRLASITETVAQRSAEVGGIEAEGTRLAKEKETALLQHSQATLGLRSVSRLADSHVELMRGAASLEDILRGQALVMQETIIVDIKNTMVELHLEQKLCAEKQVELRRCQEQLQLLKSRYQNIMESMGRNIAVTSGMDGEELQASSITFQPEVLHARCILQSSSTREKLREQGNYLDGRIVFLEHETRTLKKMLSAMREGGCGRFEESTGPSGHVEMKAEVQQLRHDEVEYRHAVQEDLKQETGELQRLQLRLRELSRRRKDIAKRLSELRALKTNRESVVRRLKAQLKRTQQKQKE